jgi:DNA-binding MurR/RpiR family transcriptional regulator
MGNVIADRVKTATLTKAQQKIADYFIRNPERVGMCSSMEVAKEIGVSDASITRFARAIGYEGFTDLKNDIYSSLAMQATGGINSLSLAERFDINQAKYGGDGSRTDFMRGLQYNLERTSQQNAEEPFEDTVSMLLRTKHHYIVGFRGCLGVASQCAWLLRFLLDHVVSISDEGPGGIGNIQDIGSEDCAVFFSVARYYKTDLRLAQLAHERGAQICVITDSVLSPLAELADTVLLAETKHMSFFNSTAALNMISEYLVTLTARKCSEQYHTKVAERDELTKELRL